METVPQEISPYLPQRREIHGAAIIKPTSKIVNNVPISFHSYDRMISRFETGGILADSFKWVQGGFRHRTGLSTSRTFRRSLS